MAEKKSSIIAAAVTPSTRRSAEAAARRRGVTLSAFTAEAVAKAARADLAIPPESRREPEGA